MGCRKKKYTTAEAANAAKSGLEAKTGKLFKVYICDFHKSFHLAVKDTPTNKCPYHPKEESHTVIKKGITYFTCPECEWNPIYVASPTDAGFTNPEIKTMGWDDVTG